MHRAWSPAGCSPWDHLQGLPQTAASEATEKLLVLAVRWFLTGSRFDRLDFMAPRFRRLAQIEEKRGNKEAAARHYTRFVELWKDCDAELRPQVDEVLARLAGLRR